MKEISPEKVAKILKHGELQKPTREIAKIVGVSNSTVARYLQINQISRTKNKGGRPPKLSEGQRRFLVRRILSNGSSTATEVHRGIRHVDGVDVSYETVLRALHGSGLRTAKKIKKPLLSPKHRAERMAFVKRYESWTQDDWKQVIFSDESKINRLGSDGLKWCWKRARQPLEDRHVIPTVKFGGGSVMVWGCISSQGVGEIIKVEGLMNSAQYCNILDRGLLGTTRKMQVNVRDIIFQHDGDPKHTSMMTKNWLHEKGINVLRWPPQSPDLNPIENVWGHLKRELNSIPHPPASIHELWDRIQESWARISPETIKKCIESMPERIMAVKAAKGGPSRF
jgi:transposase